VACSQHGIGFYVIGLVSSLIINSLIISSIGFKKPILLIINGIGLYVVGLVSSSIINNL
jgi:hypothetical protein